VFERTTQDGFCRFSGAGEAINIGIHSDLLPVRGQNVGARYQVDIEITSQPQGNGDISSPTMTRHELRGEMIAGGTMLGLESLSEGEFQGRIHLEPFHLSWTDEDGADWLPSECFVTVTLNYDGGKSSPPAEGSGEATGEAQRVTAFPEFDCQIDYQGRIEGPDTDLQLPSKVRDILPVNGVLVMVLDPEMDMDIKDIPSLEPTRNLLAISSGGKVAWTAQSRTDDTGVQYTHRRIWVYNGRLFCSISGLNESAGKPTVEIDIDSGDIIEAAPSSSG